MNKNKVTKLSFMETGKHKLTLDQRASYEIKVPGEIDASWSDWFRDITVTCERGDDDLSISTLTGHFDQAALHGILRRLYSLGIPLISVVCLDTV